MLDTNILLHLRKDRGSTFAHLPCISLHDTQVRAHSLRQIRLVHHQQIALRDSRAALARHLVSAADINHVDDEIRQLPTVVGGEVVPATLNEQQIRAKLDMQILERRQIRTNVLAHRGVRTAARLDGADAVRGQGLVLGEELGVLAREDVVGDGGDVVLGAQGVAQGQHEGGLAAADGAADADGEGAGGPVAALDDGHFPAQVGAWTAEDLVGVAVFLGVEGGAIVAVGVGDTTVVGMACHAGGLFLYVVCCYVVLLGCDCRQGE